MTDNNNLTIHYDDNVLWENELYTVHVELSNNSQVVGYCAVNKDTKVVEVRNIAFPVVVHSCMQLKELLNYCNNGGANNTLNLFELDALDDEDEDNTLN